MPPDTFRSWEKSIPHAPLVDRDAWIVARCAGREVAHLGACDSPMTEEKARRGELLHQKLQGRCKALIGYDIDADAVALLRDRYGISDILVRDLATSDAHADEAGEVVVCADVIEHVNDVGHLLTRCNRMTATGGALLISTINAVGAKQALRALFRREPVHPDHVAYYSYATLGVLLDRFGFRMIACRYFKYPTVGRTAGMAFDALYRLCPQSADGILVEGEKTRDA